MNRVEKRLRKIEEHLNQSVPGTSISRCNCDQTILQYNGVKIPPGLRAKQSVMVWILGIGLLDMPNRFLYGYEITAAIKAAEMHFLPRFRKPKLVRKFKHPQKKVKNASGARTRDLESRDAAGPGHRKGKLPKEASQGTDPRPAR
jgi:hypothetical protein